MNNFRFISMSAQYAAADFFYFVSIRSPNDDILFRLLFPRLRLPLTLTGFEPREDEWTIMMMMMMRTMMIEADIMKINRKLKKKINPKKNQQIWVGEKA